MTDVPQKAPARPKPRRVVVLNHAAAPRSAPGGTRHVELFGRLKGWQATVIAADHNALTGGTANRRSDGYQTVRTTAPSGNGWRRVLSWVSYAVMASLRCLRLPGPDVVYASSPHLLTGAAGWFVARARGSRFVLEIRDLWPLVLVEMGRLAPDTGLHRVLRRLERLLYRRADHLVVLAPGTGTYLGEEGVPADRISCIPNGADPADFIGSADRATLRKRYGLEGFVVAYTGAHGLANGLHLVLDAAEELQEELPDVRWLLVGAGPEKAKLVRAAAERRLRCVRFREPLPKAEMPDLLAAVDVGLHCLDDVPLFRYGVSPNKLFDYMAAGLPVITNTQGDTAQLVVASGGGQPVASDRIADGVRKLHAMSVEDLQVMGARGRAFIAAHHARPVLAQHLEDVLDALHASRRPIGRRRGLVAPRSAAS